MPVIYKRKGKMTKDEIMKLSNKELNLEAAKATGNPIVDIDKARRVEVWGKSDRLKDLYSKPSRHEMEQQIMVTVPVDGFAKWYSGNLSRHITREGTKTTYLLEWNPADDLIAAMELWNQIHEDKEIWWNNQSPTAELAWCRSTDPDCDYSHWITGKPDELPRLLTQAFVIYKEGQNE